MPRGGARAGAGRKKTALTTEIIVDELIFPALCQAFKSEPGQYKERYLNVELSKSDIKRVYGVAGLSIWVKFFGLVKIGGKDRNGVGYKTRWCLHLGIYETAVLIIKAAGGSIKDLPNPGFPPVKMQERLDKLNAYSANLKAKRALREIQK